MAKLNFDASTVAPNTTFEPLPAGWYNVQITESELVPTKAGTGSILKLQQTVIDGEHAGRIVYTNLNVQNPNPIAVEIANQQLSSICHATGTIQVDDSQDLHGKPYQVQVSIRPAEGAYDASNDCKKFKAIAGNKTAPQSPPASASAKNNTDSEPVATAAGSGVPPWAKK